MGDGSKYSFSAIVAAAVLAASGCSGAEGDRATPSLAERGATMTTVKLSTQDLTASVSLSGKVTVNPVFGLVAPVDGQVRYFAVKPPAGTPTTPTQVANVWAAGAAHPVRVPAGATFAGRLVDDESAVVAGMPIVSAKYAGYGLVADIDGEQAYQLPASLKVVKAQIKNGPGPFKCRVLGTIAALPEGTIPSEPDPPPEKAEPPDGDSPGQTPPPKQDIAVEGTETEGQPGASEPTGMRVVCVPPADVKMINGASVTIRIITARSKNAMVAPVEAVAGSTANGQVDVIGADGSKKTVNVKLGMTDGKVIEIRSGLKGDETLAVPGPDLRPPDGGPGGPEGPMGPDMRHGG